MKLGFLLQMLVSPFVWAGGDHSGGGAAVVCRNVDHTIRSAQLVDTYESLDVLGLGDSIFKLPGNGMPKIEKTGDATKDEELLIQEYNRVLAQPFLQMPIQSSLKAILSQNMPFMKAQIEHSYERERANYPGTYIYAPADLGGSRAIHVPYGCEIEFVVFYKDRDNGYDDLLTLNPDIWDAFSITDRLGLILHESIYQVRRMFYAETNSALTRDLTARLILLAHVADENAYKSWGLSVDLGEYRRIVALEDGDSRDAIFKLNLTVAKKVWVEFKFYDSNGKQCGHHYGNVKAGKAFKFRAGCESNREWVTATMLVDYPTTALWGYPRVHAEPSLLIEVISGAGKLLTQGEAGFTKKGKRTLFQAARRQPSYPVAKPFSTLD